MPATGFVKDKYALAILPDVGAAVGDEVGPAGAAGKTQRDGRN